MILLITFVETFKTNVIVVIDNVILRLTSHFPIQFSIKVNSLILTVLHCEIKGQVSISPIKANNSIILVSHRLSLSRVTGADFGYHVEIPSSQISLIIWVSKLSFLIVPDDCYSGNASCALN